MYISSRRLEHNGAPLSDQALCDGRDRPRLLCVQSQQGCDSVGIGEHTDGLSRKRHFDSCGHSVGKTVDPAHFVDDRDLSADPVLHEYSFVRLQDDANDIKVIMLVDYGCDFLVGMVG